MGGAACLAGISLLLLRHSEAADRELAGGSRIEHHGFGLDEPREFRGDRDWKLGRASWRSEPLPPESPVVAAPEDVDDANAVIAARFTGIEVALLR